MKSIQYLIQGIILLRVNAIRYWNLGQDDGLRPLVSQVLGILYWCNIVENEWHGGFRYSGQGDGFQSVSYI